jgi:hypothetical protein
MVPERGQKTIREVVRRGTVSPQITIATIGGFRICVVG